MVHNKRVLTACYDIVVKSSNYINYVYFKRRFNYYN